MKTQKGSEEPGSTTSRPTKETQPGGVAQHPAGPAPSPVKGAAPASAAEEEMKRKPGQEVRQPKSAPTTEQSKVSTGQPTPRAPAETRHETAKPRPTTEVEPAGPPPSPPLKPEGEQGPAAASEEKGGASKSGWEMARQAVGSGYGKAKAVGAAGLKGLEVAGDTAEAAMGAAEVAKGTVHKGIETGQAVVEGVQAAAERTGSWAAWGQDQAYQVTSTAYQSTVQPVVSVFWWLFITLPYTTVAWVASAGWRTASWVWDTAVYTGVFLASNSSGTINSLRTVNKSMDQLVNCTPHLIRDTLDAARSARAAPVEPTEAGQPEQQGKPEPTEKPRRTEVKEEQFEMPEETNVARAANEALHRVFDQQQDFADNRGTLLAEARKLAWHSWMLVALQVTALRIVLKVTEGMLGWAARAWLQLITAGIILTVMAAATPIAATAAALAFVCHQMLKQVLSVRQYGLRLQEFLAPPLHNTVCAINTFLAPYLATPSEDVYWEPDQEEQEEGEGEAGEEEEGAGEKEGERPGGKEGAPREAVEPYAVPEEGAAAEPQEEEYEEQQPGLFLGVLPTSVRQTKVVISGFLHGIEQFTASLLPSKQHLAMPKEGEGVVEDKELASIISASTTAEQVAAASRQSADAWNKASALAAATAFTVLDTLRVILLGLSTRFEISLPEWIPGLTPNKDHSNSPAMAHEPHMVQFNETAGKGPISGAHAVGAAL